MKNKLLKHVNKLAALFAAVIALLGLALFSACAGDSQIVYYDVTWSSGEGYEFTSAEGKLPSQVEAYSVLTFGVDVDEGYVLDKVEVNGITILPGDGVYSASADGDLNISATVVKKTDDAGKTLQSIGIKARPTKSSYTEGEIFDPAGMIIMANYSDGTQAEVSGYTWSPDGELTTDVTEITIKYAEGGTEKTVALALSVYEAVASVQFDVLEIKLQDGAPVLHISGTTENVDELTLRLANTTTDLILDPVTVADDGSYDHTFSLEKFNDINATSGGYYNLKLVWGNRFGRTGEIQPSLEDITGGNGETFSGTMYDFRFVSWGSEPSHVCIQPTAAAPEIVVTELSLAMQDGAPVLSIAGTAKNASSLTLRLASTADSFNYPVALSGNAFEIDVNLNDFASDNTISSGVYYNIIIRAAHSATQTQSDYRTQLSEVTAGLDSTLRGERYDFSFISWTSGRNHNLCIRPVGWSFADVSASVAEDNGSPVLTISGRAGNVTEMTVSVGSAEYEAAISGGTFSVSVNLAEAVKSANTPYVISAEGQPLSYESVAVDEPTLSFDGGVYEIFDHFRQQRYRSK